MKSAFQKGKQLERTWEIFDKMKQQGIVHNVVMIVHCKGRLAGYHSSQNNPVALSKIVKHCKASVCYDRQYTRISYAYLGDAKIKGWINAALIQIGFEEMDGQVPHGNLERRIRTFLDAQAQS